MKIKKIKSNCGLGDSVFFDHDNILGQKWHDGSGFLEVNGSKYNCYYVCESGSHKDRVREIKLIRDYYVKAQSDLIKIDKKIREIKLNEGDLK